MALTGTGVRVGSAVYNSGDNRYFRGMASDGNALYSFTRTQGRVVNTVSGTVTNSGSSFGSNTLSARSATYHNSQVLVYLNNDDIYVWTPGTGLAADALIDNLTYASESGLTGTPFFYGLASHNGTLYAADHTSRRLVTIAMDGTVTPVGSSTYTNQITGLTSYDGKLLGVESSSGNDRLGEFNTTTGAFTLIHSTNRLPDDNVDSMGEHGGNLYMGAFADGIYRAYDVKWDDSVAGVEVNEGANETWDLSAISQDADSFAFSSGYTAPSWLTISGDNLVVTDAPDVSADTEYTPSIDAVRDGVRDTFEHSITVRDVPAVAPTIEVVSEQDIVVGTTDYELEITTTGVTEDMEIVAEGDWDGGFYHTWDQDAGIITIKNEEVDALRTDKTFVINVTDSGTVVATRSIAYNVVPTAPVIDIISDRIKIYKNILFSELIPVANEPTEANIRSRLVGMKAELGTKDDEDGVLVNGRLPSDAIVDFESFDAPLTVSNGGGSHSRDIPFEIAIPNFVFGFNDSSDNVYMIDETGALAFTYPDLPSASYDPVIVASDGGSVFLFEDSSNTLHKVLIDGTLAWTKSDLPNVTYNNVVASSDGGVFLIEDTVDDDLHKIDSDGNTEWTYTALPSGQYRLQADSEGGVFVQRNNSTYYKINSDGTLGWTTPSLGVRFVATVDGGVVVWNAYNDIRKYDSEGNLAWTYTGLPSSFVSSVLFMATSDNGVLILEPASTDNIFKIASDGTLAFEYTKPSGNWNVIASSDDGFFLYPATLGSTDEIRKISATGSLLWTYSLTTDLYRIAAGAEGNVFLWRDDTDDILNIGSDGTLQWTNTDLTEALADVVTTPIIFLGA